MAVYPTRTPPRPTPSTERRSPTDRTSSPQVERASEASLRQRLTLAQERIRELDNDNRHLRGQIALLHGQLRANRIAATPVTDIVHDANTQFMPPKSLSVPR